MTVLANRGLVQRILYRAATAKGLQELFEQARGGDPSYVQDDCECELPMGDTQESVAVGAWVLAVFETSVESIAPPSLHAPISRPPASSRATCAPARVIEDEDGKLALRFAVADWQRIVSYAKLRSESPPNSVSERVRTARPVQMPSVFPAAPLPQVETMCIVHWFSEGVVGEGMADALCASCHGFEDEAALFAFAKAQSAAGQKIDGFVFGLPADDALITRVKAVHALHPHAVIVCLVSGARAQTMRALFEAGADEILQAQTPAAEVAVTLLALVRRHATKGDALGAA